MWKKMKQKRVLTVYRNLLKQTIIQILYKWMSLIDMIENRSHA